MLKDFTELEFDIIVLAGQSNADGTGYGHTDVPFMPQENIWYLDRNMTIRQAEEYVEGNRIRTNFSLPFALNYVNQGLLAPGRHLLIIRAAAGGTGFLDHRWRPQDDLFIQMISMIETARALNPGNRFVALLWHQGETDALLNADFKTHYGHLQTLVALIREACGEPELPFIAGDFVQDWKRKNAGICKPVVRAMRFLCTGLPRAGFVESIGLLSNNEDSGNGDDIHFCRSAVYALGQRYFDAFNSIIEKGRYLYDYEI